MPNDTVNAVPPSVTQLHTFLEEHLLALSTHKNQSIIFTDAGRYLASQQTYDLIAITAHTAMVINTPWLQGLVAQDLTLSATDRRTLTSALAFYKATTTGTD